MAYGQSGRLAEENLKPRAGEPLRGPVPKLSTNFEEIVSRADGNLEEQNKAMEPSIIIIIYYIIIINKRVKGIP